MADQSSSDLVFDVGAHKGEDSDFYLKLGYRVVAIEANPDLADGLRRRFAREIGEGRYVVVQKAISDTAGELTFYLNDKMSIWGTTDPKWAQRNRELGAASREIRVESIRFADLLREYGCPHYLKIDVEGADMLCVNGLRDVDRRPRYLSLESSKTDWAELLAELDTLEALGYTRFAVVNQRKHRPGRFRALDGSGVDHVFEKGATGPFGENLAADWCTREEALRRYRRIFLMYRLLGDYAPLARLLRRIPVLRRVLRLVGWYDTHALRA